ncbi:MAG: hypothetical protein A2639_00560 [Candidatus Staskawiczbacteria bacterium RIFCSPHIGHO2_01_FULL_34_27]|uniref:Zinc-ribbon domain-containing protein n=1 Tax=Candidatus Staskawiczbacteria bacterium RIFCSPHIGHO2_01_FULL_34_27 TaxID=1802199 RepID=A0A1G2HJG2_9BACT|nr:MAG: hypothetical protein A2639_00560 [Candidatus Staskawiczbacteria bacterium RIFCSPHIGHO2_01_FULL_34_27]
MSEIYDRQKVQEDLQRSEEFVDVFSKVVSGKAGYKTKIEMKPITTKCKSCGVILGEKQKFCHECGAKNEITEKTN